VYEICAKKCLEGTFTGMHAPSFLVCDPLTACVRAHVHSLEGTLISPLSHCF